VRRGGRRRLRGRLLLPSIIVGSCLTGLAIARAFELRTAEQDAQQAYALQIVTVAARTLDATVAQSQTLLESIGNSLDPDAAPGFNDAVLRRLFMKAPVPFAKLWIADSTGRNIGAAPQTGADRAAYMVSQDRSFQRAMQHRKFALGDVVTDSTVADRPYVLSFALPVIDSATSRVSAVVGATIRIDSLEAVRTARSLPDGSVLTIMDSAGTVILRTLDAEHWIGRSFAKDVHVGENFAAGEGVGATRSADGENRLTGYTRATRLPWMVYIGIPARYTVDVARNQFLRDLGFGGVITLLVLVVGFVIANRTATPVESLTRDAAAIAAGDMSRRSTLQSDDEVGDLARAFNSMADTIAERDAALRASQEQLLHAQKMEALGSFAGGIAHDFNNYLSAIVGHTELAALTLPDDSPAREDLMEVMASSARAADLTKQILIFSRKQVVEPHVIDLSAVLRGIERLIRRLLGEDRALEVECTSEPTAILIDHGQLEQVIVNLVANARDATPNGGMIRVSTSVINSNAAEPQWNASAQLATHARLIVSDNGAGMTASVRERIFDPFFSTKSRGQGTGLGLAIAYGIVQQSGGSITVESEVGLGTTFTVLFPLTSDEAEHDAAQPGHEVPHGRGRILVAEDDASVRNSTVRALQRAGYDVVAAEDGPSALARFREVGASFDLLLSDVVMPGMSGSILAKRARALQPDIPVLFMSGYADDDSIREGLASGLVTCLAKPFSAAALCAAVHRTITNRSTVIAAH
jgi:signal transduction histidine kinase/ActR/RegA family two-component response regulator